MNFLLENENDFMITSEDHLSEFDRESALSRRPSGNANAKRMDSASRAKRNIRTPAKAKARREQKKKRRNEGVGVKKNRKEYGKNYRKKNKSKLKSRRKSAFDLANRYTINQVSKTKLTALQVLLASLRTAHFAHWSSHWQVEQSYGDHLLLDKLYTSLVDEIDTLAEKIVGEFGAMGVEPVSQIQMMSSSLMPLVEIKSQGDPLMRALIIEESLQSIFKSVYGILKNQMSLGLDDFIMSTANAHETNLYLLRQRIRSSHF